MKRIARVTALAVLAVSIGGSNATAQGFGIRLERGEFGVDGRGRQQLGEGASSRIAADYQQWLRVPVSGFLLHPRVLRYSAAIRPLFGQHSTGALDQGTKARSLGLDASVTLFQARRINLTFQATKSSGVSRGDFGTHNAYDNADFTAIAFLRDRYFPTTVTYTDRTLEDTWESAYVTNPVQRNQRASRLRGEIRNKKLTTLVEQSSYQDLRGSSDHEALTAQARHRLEWGKGSSLLSSLNSYRRTGSSAIRRLSLSERASILHTETVSSALSYGRQTWTRGRQSGRNVNYEARTRFNPSIDFDASIAVSGQRFVTPGVGGVERLRISPSVRRVFRFDEDSRFSVGGSVGTEKLSRTLPSDVELDVLEEPHSIDETRAFTLDQLQAASESIEIWNEARTLLLEAGIDYRVVEVGPYVEIHVLPGSRVFEGEVLLVTYRYRSLAVEDVGLFFVNYETALHIRAVSLRHGRRQRSQDISGPSGTIEDPDEVDLWFGLGFSRRTRIGAVSVNAQRRTRSASEISYTTDELRSDLALPRLGRFESRMRGSLSRTVAGELDTRTISAGSSVSYEASRRLRLSGGVDGWVWNREMQGTETFLSGHAMANWRFAQMSAVLTFDQVRRSNQVSNMENRWSARIVRRF